MITPSRAVPELKDVVVTEVLAGAAPATAANYGTFFISDRVYKVISIEAVHGTASSSGTVMVERLQGTEAKDAGDDLLSSAISTAGTADTVNTGTLTSTTANLTIADGDRLGLVDGGTLTSGANLVVSVRLRPIDDL